MLREMEAHGLTLFERFLSGIMTGLGWLLILVSIITSVFAEIFATGGFVGGVMAAAAAATGITLILGSSGLRQNRAAMELAYALLALTGLIWLVRGIWDLEAGAILLGITFLLAFVFLAYLRNLALKARFRPRIMSLRQFETMVAIADAMIHGDGEDVLSPIQVAINADDALARLDTPVKRDILRVMFLVEWLLPLRIARPFPFSALGSHDRRLVVEKVIGSKGPFRDVARFLKILACIGYYSDPAVMRDVGYIPFEERSRSQIDQAPLEFADPAPVETR